MHQKQLARLLFRPSLFSGMVTSIVAVATLAMLAWPAVTNSAFLAQFIDGSSYVLARAIQESPQIGNFAKAFSASPLTYNLLIVIVGILVGVSVYVILQLTSKSIVGTYDTVQTVRGGRAASPEAREIGTKFGLRALSAIVAVVFAVVFVNFVLPYSIFITRVGLHQILDWGILQILSAVVIVTASLHIFVVLFRLLLLKPRVFGGQLDVLEAIYTADAKHN